MDENLLYIPPCCVNDKLPRAILHAPHRSLVFYTKGDVTMEAFYRAVSHMVRGKHVMVLSMQLMTDDVVHFLNLCFERGWISELIVSTAYPVDIAGMMKEYAKHVLYVVDEKISEVSSHMVLYNDENAITINGPMLSRRSSCTLVSYSAMLHLYALSGQNDWGNPIRNILFPDAMRHRKALKSYKKSVSNPRLLNFLEMKFPPYDE